jgi:hypothetical protein
MNRTEKKRKEKGNQRKGRKGKEIVSKRESEKKALEKGMRSHYTVTLAFFPCAVHHHHRFLSLALSVPILYKTAFYSPFVYLIILFRFLNYCLFPLPPFCLFVFGGVSLSVCCCFFFPV